MFHSSNAIWCAPTWAGPSRAATAVAAASASRSATVRTSRSRPTRASRPTARPTGRSPTCSTAACRPDSGQVDRDRGPLHEHGGRRRRAHAVPEAEDEDDLEHQVDRGRADRDQQRGRGVLPSAQPADRRVRHQDRGHAERADPQVGLRVAGGGAGRPEAAHQRAGQHRDGQRHRHRHRDREPDALHRLVGRLPLVAGPEQPRHRGGRPVRQEDEDRVAGDQDRRGDGEPGQLRRAEVADDRGVGQHVHRLGDERAQRRHRQPEDLPVPLRPEPHSARSSDRPTGASASRSALVAPRSRCEPSRSLIGPTGTPPGRRGGGRPR